MRRCLLLVLMLLTMVGCATLPTGPSVMVLPPPGKPFDQFNAEDAACRQWALQQIGISPQETANQSTATGAIIGTAIGAGLGAALGSISGDAGAGAAIGGGMGLLMGTSSGANAGMMSGYEAQRRYDIQYMQCMYAKGNQVPGVPTRRTQAVPPPPPGYPPPPDYFEN